MAPLKQFSLIVVTLTIILIWHTTEAAPFNGFRQARTLFPWANRRSYYSTNPLTIHKLDPIAQQYKLQNMNLNNMPVSPTIVRGRYDLDPYPKQHRQMPSGYMGDGATNYDNPIITRRGGGGGVQRLFSQLFPSRILIPGTFVMRK